MTWNLGIFRSGYHGGYLMDCSSFVHYCKNGFLLMLYRSGEFSFYCTLQLEIKIVRVTAINGCVTCVV